MPDKGLYTRIQGVRSPWKASEIKLDVEVCEMGKRVKGYAGSCSDRGNDPELPLVI